MRLTVAFFLLFLFSCDFTPRIYKDILKAQEAVSLRQYKNAIFQYKKILSKEIPDLIRAKVYIQLGDIYSIYLDRSRESIKYFEKVKSATNNPVLLIKAQEKLAKIYFSYLKDYPKAKEEYSKLIRFEPKLPLYGLYLTNLGQTHMYLKNYKLAEKIFNKLIKEYKNEYSKRAYHFLGLIHFEQKDWKKAIASWELYLKKEKRKDRVIQTKFYMANAYETLEQLKSAYNVYYSILREYPNTEVVQNRLKAIYARKLARQR